MSAAKQDAAVELVHAHGGNTTREWAVRCIDEEEHPGCRHVVYVGRDRQQAEYLATPGEWALVTRSDESAPWVDPPGEGEEAACGLFAEQRTHDSRQVTCEACTAALVDARERARWIIAAASLIATLRLGSLVAIAAAGFDVRELMARCEVAGVTDRQGVGFRDELEQYVGELLAGEVVTGVGS